MQCVGPQRGPQSPKAGALGQGLPREVIIRWSFIRVRPGTVLNTWQALPPFCFAAAFLISWRVNSAPERVSGLPRVTQLVDGKLGF